MGPGNLNDTTYTSKNTQDKRHRLHGLVLGGKPPLTLFHICSAFFILQVEIESRKKKKLLNHPYFCSLSVIGSSCIFPARGALELYKFLYPLIVFSSLEAYPFCKFFRSVRFAFLVYPVIFVFERLSLKFMSLEIFHRIMVVQKYIF